MIQKLIVKLEKISGSQIQIDILYEFLKIRKYNISNLSIPTYSEHIKFVLKHPYRAWYLIKFDKRYVGTIYILDNNCIGLSLFDNHKIFPSVIELIHKKHKPLKEIKSVRPPYFHINVSPDNKIIESQLIEIGAIKVQSTYKFNSIQITF